jgi:type IV secretion system protein VirB10
VRRFSRKSLAILFGGASFLVLASMTLAMSPGMTRAEAVPKELYSTSNKPTAEGLAALPIAYSAVRPAPPELGPPLPGDLGPPILAAQREGRLAFGDVPGPEPYAGQDPYAGEDPAALLAAETAEVRAGAIFFAVAGPGQAGAPRRAEASAAPESSDPFAALARLGREDAAQPGQGPAAGVSDPSVYNPHRLEDPVSPWQVMAGTVIPAVLLTGINSDLPGQVIGQVTEPVYDTVTGRHVLIPQGAKLIGRYDNVIAFGQSRALVV